MGEHLLSHEAINKCSSVRVVSRLPRVCREPSFLVALWEIWLATIERESRVDHSMAVFFLSHLYLDAQGAIYYIRSLGLAGIVRIQSPNAFQRSRDL